MRNLIITDPRILGGKPIIRETRISVEFVLGLVNSGMTVEDILREYPHLTQDGVQAAIDYGREAGNDK